jgi:hypothetical protein
MAYRSRRPWFPKSPYSPHRPLATRDPRQSESADHFLTAGLSAVEALIASLAIERREKATRSAPQFSPGFMAARRRGARFSQGANAPRSYSAER